GKDHLNGATPVTQAVQVGKNLRAGKTPVMKPLEPVFAKHERDVGKEDIKKRTIDGKVVEVHRKRWKNDENTTQAYPSGKAKEETQYLNEEQRKEFEVGTKDVGSTKALDLEQGHSVGDTPVGKQGQSDPEKINLRKTDFVVDDKGKMYAG